MSSDANLQDNASINRRHFVGLGAMALGGVVVDPLARHALAAPVKSVAVIQVFLSGGPSQLDTFDPKPAAPVEYRGPFDAIQTNVPGIQLSELFPRLAAQMDKWSIVRSVTHGIATSSVAQHLMYTGYLPKNVPPTSNERPALGAVAAVLRGPRRVGVPAYVCLPRVPPLAGAAYLPLSSDPFELSDPGPKQAALRAIRPPVPLDQERQAALAKYKITLHGANRGQKLGLNQAALKAAGSTAASLASNPALLASLKLQTETARVLASYGPSVLGQRLLMARRLIEAGVTSVVVEDTGWAMHSQIEMQLTQKAPPLDQGLTALVADLSRLGLFKDVLVVVHGEFGRAAKLNRGSRS